MLPLVFLQIFLLWLVSPYPQSLIAAIVTANISPEWWRSFIESHSTYYLCTLVPFSLVVGTYWINGLLMLTFDFFKRPEAIKEFKIQKTKQFDFAKIGKVASNLLINQVLVLGPALVLLGILTSLGIGIRLTGDLPTSWEVCWNLVGYFVTDEILFYYSHVWLHTKDMYAKVHKIHHEFTSPIGLVASYCHPLEMLLSNVFPLGLGAVFCNSHAYTFYVWMIFAVLGTQHHHAGYRLPWNFFFDEQPNFHDFHHEKFNCNFGMLGWLDRLHKTDLKWRQKLSETQKTCKGSGRSFWRFTSDNI